MCDVESLINQGFQALSNPDKFYFNAHTKMKRQVVSSIFPEKLVFDGFTYRTARLNGAVALIYKLGEGLSKNEEGETVMKNDFSCLVDPYGFEP